MNNQKNAPERSSSALVLMVTSSSERHFSTRARCSATARGWDRIRFTNPTRPCGAQKEHTSG